MINKYIHTYICILEVYRVLRQKRKSQDSWFVFNSQFPVKYEVSDRGQERR